MADKEKTIAELSKIAQELVPIVVLKTCSPGERTVVAYLLGHVLEMQTMESHLLKYYKLKKA